MKDIPIIYSAPMVLALLREAREPGTGKTMTRRLAYIQRKVRDPAIGESPTESIRSNWLNVKAGDRLWVKETYRTSKLLDSKSMRKISFDALDAGYRRPWCPIEYIADGANGNWTSTDWGEFGKLRPCIFMPRWSSRLTLIVKAVKIERMQRISNEDARAEGVDFWPDFVKGRRDPFPAERFRDLWMELHGPNAWADNPWVVALSFSVHECNIDAMPVAEAA